MSHVFSFPNAAAPTEILRLHPALVTIQEEDFTFVQRLVRTADGTPWVFALAGHRLQTYAVIVEGLPEADFGGFAGYRALWTFFDLITNGAMSACSLTHTDGNTATVRLIPDRWQFPEGKKGSFSGQFALMRE